MINVIRRQRKLKNGIALYLDYRICGKRIQEPTGLHIYPGSDEITKQLNKDNNIRFEILRNDRQKELLNGIALLPVNRQKIDFLQYYKEYFVKYPTRERRAASVFKKLQAFHKGNVLPLAAIDEAFLVKFKNFLESKLTGETPHNYFKLLCKVIRQATKERLFAVNPSEDVIIKRMEGIPKDTLNIEELKTLYACHCSNDTVKRAFLFCCFTGLRYCDVSKLKWENVQNGILSIVQSKTRHNLTAELHQTALSLLGNVGSATDLVFSLPTNNGYNKVVKGWMKKAEIDKHITAHCGRHTFATLLVQNGADILSVSAVMGHKTIKYTQRYTRVADTMRSQTIQKLPTM
ncbi:MAG: site-specific integrase [Ferruginibacter sp.]